MTNEMKKRIVAAIAAGSAVAASAYGINKAGCDYVIPHEGKNICVSAEVKDYIETSVGVSKGFGGMKFDQGN